MPRGDNLDVSFVVPLDQSVCDSAEDPQDEVSRTPQLIDHDNNLRTVTESKQRNHIASVILERFSNDDCSEVRKRSCPTELQTSSNVGGLLVDTLAN